MLHEYAVDPAVMASWESFRYFFDKFGVGEGRLISLYPKTWKALVRAAYDDATPLTKKRVEERLANMHRKVIKTKRAYRDDQAWVTNAVEAHADEPFRAVVCSAPHEARCVLHPDDLDDSVEQWKADRDGKVNRNTTDLAALTAPLLRHSTEIMFVDQHFDFAVKFGRPLAAFLTAARDGKALTRVEYHLNASEDAARFESEAKRCAHHLNLRPDESIVFVRWVCIDGGENQHPRYILTNRGGARFDYGLDEGDGTTDWSLLSEALWQERRDQYGMGTPAFDFVDAWRVTGHTVAKVRWDHTRWVDV